MLRNKAELEAFEKQVKIDTAKIKKTHHEINALQIDIAALINSSKQLLADVRRNQSSVSAADTNQPTSPTSKFK